MKKTNLLLLGLALSAAATLCAAEENSIRQLLERKRQQQAAPQTTAPQAPAPQNAAPAPAERVATAPAAKNVCGKKKPKSHGKGWAKGHDKHC